MKNTPKTKKKNTHSCKEYYVCDDALVRIKPKKFKKKKKKFIKIIKKKNSFHS